MINLINPIKGCKTFVRLTMFVLAVLASPYAFSKIYVEGSTLYINEEITDSTFNTVEKLITQHAISDWVIRSKSGTPNAAMLLGKVAYDEQINLSVLDYCLDACANYLFPAAASKRILNDAVVAWSGNIVYRQQKELESLSQLVEQDIQEMDIDEETKLRLLENTLSDFNALMIDTIKHEVEYFDYINIDSKVCWAGLESNSKNGFTMSPNTMQSYGIYNVVSENESTTTKLTANGVMQTVKLL